MYPFNHNFSCKAKMHILCTLLNVCTLSTKYGRDFWLKLALCYFWYNFSCKVKCNFWYTCALSWMHVPFQPNMAQIFGWNQLCAMEKKCITKARDIKRRKEVVKGKMKRSTSNGMCILVCGTMEWRPGLQCGDARFTNVMADMAGSHRRERKTRPVENIHFGTLPDLNLR